MFVPYDQQPSYARVWVYQSNREFTAAETAALEKTLHDYAEQWRSHGEPLPAWAGVLHHRFIVLVADEHQVKAGGCSIDTSVSWLKDIERKYNCSLFNRQQIAYREGEKIKTASPDEFRRLLAAGQVNDETLVFNNLVVDKAALETQWVAPFGKSWHRRLYAAERA